MFVDWTRIEILHSKLARLPRVDVACYKADARRSCDVTIAAARESGWTIDTICDVVVAVADESGWNIDTTCDAIVVVAEESGWYTIILT